MSRVPPRVQTKAHELQRYPRALAVLRGAMMSLLTCVPAVSHHSFGFSVLTFNVTELKSFVSMVAIVPGCWYSIFLCFLIFLTQQPKRLIQETVTEQKAFH